MSDRTAAEREARDVGGEDLDVRGLLCPLPVLKIAKRLKTMAPGAVLKVVATDPATQIDVPHYCAASGTELVGQSAGAGLFRYTLRRA